MLLDLLQKELTLTGVNFVVDLHCTRSGQLANVSKFKPIRKGFCTDEDDYVMPLVLDK